MLGYGKCTGMLWYHVILSQYVTNFETSWDKEVYDFIGKSIWFIIYDGLTLGVVPVNITEGTAHYQKSGNIVGER